MSAAIDQLKFADLEREMLSPLRGLALTKDELFVATMLLEATAAQPIGIKHLRRALEEARGYGVIEREVKDIVRTLRKLHELPIISRRKKGGGLWCARTSSR